MRLEHEKKGFCAPMNDDVDQYAVIFHPNIRTFGIIEKKKFSSVEELWDGEPKNSAPFQPINYCYHCGAKFPDRLDKELTKILQKEYGLDSWRDYKKAPKEFHTDAWWKKRGL
ncbi:hypothetical protein AGMMS49949_05110 [Alphaproteobacteria bacterium]|nr:hypothetical protein AGMMS49949_05110 [Alphaproteobacteria bacterium]GHT00145.1 hypothetical protein AGMMS50296_8420 [Alphaproteobacteria bacterium]